MIEWNEDKENFYFVDYQPKEFLEETVLRKVFRDITKGLYYRIF